MSAGKPVSSGNPVSAGRRAAPTSVGYRGHTKHAVLECVLSTEKSVNAQSGYLMMRTIEERVDINVRHVHLRCDSGEVCSTC